MQKPQVGVGVIIVKDNKILLGKRKNAHGSGTWCPPGGHLDFKESWEECAKRETKEETGISIKNISYITATNDIFEKEQKHYITIFMRADYADGTVKLKEPDKCEKWEWFDWDNLPTPLFIAMKNLLDQHYSPLPSK